jgi:apolipoprotein N-acyltransferase
VKRFFTIAASALLSGFLLAAAMPPADRQYLGWVCFIPLLASLRGARLAYAVLAPLASGFFAAYLTLTGLFYPWARLEGEEAWHYSGFLLYLLALAPAFVGATLINERTWARAALLASAFVCAESLLLLYLPAHLALTQYRSPAMLALTPWIGIWGVSWTLWFFQVGVALNWDRAVSSRRLGWPVAIQGTGLLAVFGAAVWVHPQRPSRANGTVANGEIRLAAIQSVLPEVEKMAAWSGDAKSEGAGFVVWPELSAVAIAAGGRTENLKELSASPSQPAFVTTFPDDSNPKPFNTASVFFSGQETPRYRKRKPFGGESQQHQAGTLPVAVQSGGSSVGLNICFDSCFPNVIRDTASLGDLGFIALPCMGPESPYGVIQAIHGAFTPFRSAELGIPIARGESSAFAMITDADGRIVAEAKPGFEGFITGDVGKARRWTLIKAVGDWPLYACWIALFLAGMNALRSKKAQPASLETTVPSSFSS